jgi:tetratricopeptide (TPR) repeat protein
VAEGRTRRQLLCFTAYAIAAIGLQFAHLSEGRFQDGQALWLRLFAEAIFLSPLMMVLHEFAHAGVGRLVGLRVYSIRFGSGPVVARMWMGDCELMFNLVPFGGCCVVRPQRRETARWRLVAMVSAGPLTNALVVCLAVACVWVGDRPIVTSETLREWLEAMILLNAYSFATNLLPRVWVRDGIEHRSDGRHLVDLIRRKSNLLDSLAGFYRYQIDLCLRKDRLAEARAVLQQWLAGSTRDSFMSVLELNLLGAEGRWAEARRCALEWQKLFSGPLDRTALSTWAAVATIYSGGDPAEAKKLCDESVEIEPWERAGQVAQALVCMANCQDSDAKALLGRAGNDLPWAARLAASHLWAEFYRRHGNLRRARRWQTRAARWDPHNAFRPPFVRPRNPDPLIATDWAPTAESPASDSVAS